MCVQNWGDPNKYGPPTCHNPVKGSPMEGPLIFGNLHIGCSRKVPGSFGVSSWHPTTLSRSCAWHRVELNTSSFKVLDVHRVLEAKCVWPVRAI